MIDRILTNFSLALEAVLANKMRSVLTALGIIFGVAAVIAMLGIGAGAQQEILDQIKLVGVNNIIITPVVEQTEEEETTSPLSEKTKFSPGLSLRDAASIQRIVPGIAKVSPEVILDKYIIKDGIRRSAKLVGIDNHYFDIANFELALGELFTDRQRQDGDLVCIIGKGIQSRFFAEEEPLDKMIKVGDQWLRVIGVLEPRIITDENINRLGIRDYNMDVYAPINTVLIRYRDRSLITKARIEAAKQRSRGDDEEEPSEDAFAEQRNYHQIDRLVVQAEETVTLGKMAEVMSRMLERRHFGAVDFQVAIPELLIKQQQRTNQIFNVVLGALAGISLLVGGIGIMNIMLASVLERIKEIGLRLAVGAQKMDIIWQFLLEATLISITGGLIGVLLGMLIAVGISRLADIPTIITLSSILLSFGVAATVGLIFGIAPARKAANQDPITSLRYE